MLVFKQVVTIFKVCCSISCFIFKFKFEKTKIKVLDTSSKFLGWTKPKLVIGKVYKIEQNWMNMFCSILFTSMLSNVWYSRLQTLTTFFWILSNTVKVVEHFYSKWMEGMIKTINWALWCTKWLPASFHSLLFMQNDQNLCRISFKH
jgi:hypothetical protein